MCALLITGDWFEPIKIRLHEEKIQNEFYCAINLTRNSAKVRYLTVYEYKNRHVQCVELSQHIKSKYFYLGYIKYFLFLYADSLVKISHYQIYVI